MIIEVIVGFDVNRKVLISTFYKNKKLIQSFNLAGNIFSGAQLLHNDFWILTNPLRTCTYNCNETLNTTIRTLLANMSGHS